MVQGIDLSELSKKESYMLLSQVAYHCYDKFPPRDLQLRDAIQEVSDMAEEHVEDEA